MMSKNAHYVGVSQGSEQGCVFIHTLSFRLVISNLNIALKGRLCWNDPQEHRTRSAVSRPAGVHRRHERDDGADH